MRYRFLGTHWGRSLALVLLIGSLAVVAAPGSPALAAARSKMKIGLNLSETTAIQGERVAFSGKVKKAPAGTKIFLQERVGSRWVKVGKGKISTTHKYRITKRPLAGLRSYRTVIKKSRKVPGGFSKTRSLRIYAHSAIVATASFGVPTDGSRATITGRVTSYAPGVNLVLQQRSGTQWAALKSVPIGAGGYFETSLRPNTPWPTYRLVKPTDAVSGNATSASMSPRAITTRTLPQVPSPTLLPIPGPGPIARFKWVTTGPQSLSFRHGAAAAGQIVMALYDTSGTRIRTWGAKEERISVLAAGTYEVVVYADGATGSVNFVATPTPTQRLTINGPSVSVSAAVGTLLTFAATEGMIVHLGHPAKCNTHLSPVGGIEVTPLVSEPREIWQIPATGEYEVFLPLDCEATSVFAEALDPIYAPIDGLGPYTAQARPFEATMQTIDLVGGAEMSLTPTGWIDTEWVIKDAAGNNLARSGAAGDPFNFDVPATGSYTAFGIPVENDAGRMSADLCTTRTLDTTAGTPVTLDSGNCEGRRVVVSLPVGAGRVPNFAITNNLGLDPEICRLRNAAREALGECGTTAATTSGTYQLAFSRIPKMTSATVTPWLTSRTTTQIDGTEVTVNLTAASQGGWVDFQATAGDVIEVEATGVALAAPANWLVTVRRVDGNFRLDGFGTVDGRTATTVPITTTGLYRLAVGASTTGQITVRVKSTALN